MVTLPEPSGEEPGDIEFEGTGLRTSGGGRSHKGSGATRMSDIMSRNVEVIPPDCSVREAAQKMKQIDCGILPVCDGDRLVGMVTDRDIVLRAVSEGKSFDTPCSQVMTSPVVACYEDDDLGKVAHLMEKKQIRRIVVLDRNKRLVGIASLGDMAVKGSDREISGEVLEQVSQPGGKAA